MPSINKCKQNTLMVTLHKNTEISNCVCKHLDLEKRAKSIIGRTKISIFEKTLKREIFDPRKNNRQVANIRQDDLQPMQNLLRKTS